MINLEVKMGGSSEERLAVSELSRFVQRVFDDYSRDENVTPWFLQWFQVKIIMETVTIDSGSWADGEFRWIISRTNDGETIVHIMACHGASSIYSVYCFAEKYLGAQFTIRGDEFGYPTLLPETERHQERPQFAMRGTLPWHNFLEGPTGWNVEDYLLYIEQLAKLRYNLLMFHVYTGGLERYWTYVEPFIQVSYMNTCPIARFDTSLTAQWGSIPMITKNFIGGTDRYYSQEEFGTDAAVGITDQSVRYAAATKLLQKVIAHAHERGIKVALGFEPGIVPPEIHSVVPHTVRLENLTLDPLHPVSQEILRNSLKYIAQHYPDIDYVVLWQHEHAVLTHHAPRPNTRYEQFCDTHEHAFAYLEQRERRFDGCWALAMFLQASEILKEVLPRVGVVISGWGGSGQFPDLLRGLHEQLPSSIIFSCLAPSLGEVEGPKELLELSNRDIWMIPWFEGDHQLWHPQPRIFHLENQFQQAEREHVRGIIAIHWRIREIADQFSFFAQRAWRTSLKAEIFYEMQWSRDFPDLPRNILSKIMDMDRCHWFNGALSPEFYGYDSTWGRLREPIISSITTLLQEIGSLVRSPSFGLRLYHLKTMLEFSLLLDQISRQLAEAEAFKLKILEHGTHSDAPAWHRTALQILRDVPVEQAICTYASKLNLTGKGPSHRGELGVLCSLNQRLVTYYRQLYEFFDHEMFPLPHNARKLTELPVQK